MGVRAALFAWTDDFEHLMGRIRGQTLQLTEDYRYKDLQFVDHRMHEYDYALVFNYANEPIECPLTNVWVVILEPPEIIQGGLMPHPQAGANIYSFCSGYEWPTVLGYGITQTQYTSDEYKPSTKPKKCSMICSDKDYLPWHRKRREILHALQSTDLDIDFFGAGMELTDDPRIKGSLPLNDKSEGLQPYSFVIDFENSPYHVITDKMLDPLISGSISITNSLAAWIFPGAYEWVNFRYSTEDIVRQIKGLLEPQDLSMYDQPVLSAKRNIIDGPRNVCEWFYRKISK